MATLNTTLKQFIVTASANADFRAIAQIWHDFFGTTCGFVQGSDTGQVNLATVNFPGANNTDGGFEIWKFNDSLQATFPVYFKIAYGRGADANSWRVTMIFSMAGTDGAGNFVGTSSAVATWNYSNTGTRTNADTTAYKIVGSGDTGRFVICFFPNVQSTPFGRVLCIERTRDSTGAYTGEGILGVTSVGNDANNSNGGWFQFGFNPGYQPSWKQSNANGDGIINYIKSIAGGNNGYVGSTPRSNADNLSTLSGGKVWAFPFFPGRPGWMYPLTSVMSIAMGDFPVDYSTVSLTFYGGTHTYMPLGPTMSGFFNIGLASTVGWLMQYE